MPEYEFVNDAGEYGTVFFANADDAPSIGETIEHDGQLIRRIPSIPKVANGFKPFVSRSLARNHPHAPHLTPDGSVGFSTQRDVDEFVAKNNADPTQKKIVWDR